MSVESLQELHRRLIPYLIRRYKRQVEKSLPSKVKKNSTYFQDANIKIIYIYIKTFISIYVYIQIYERLNKFCELI